MLRLQPTLGGQGSPGTAAPLRFQLGEGDRTPSSPAGGGLGGPQNKLLESAVLNPHSPTSSNPFAWHSSHGFQKLRLGGGFWPILASLLGDLGQVTSPAGWV